MTGWSSSLQRLEQAGIPVIPLESLRDERVRKQLHDAGMVYGVDNATQMGSVFFGDCARDEEIDGELDSADVIAFALDFDSNDLDRLAAATRQIKGSCRHELMD